MTILSTCRLMMSLVSIFILVAGFYLLWSWYDAPVIQDPSGAVHPARESWRLWTALGLLAWSLLGRVAVLALVARPDSQPSRAVRSAGKILASPTGSALYVEEHGPTGAAPIIFTHGWGMDSTFWHYAKQQLADRFRLVLWDLPGLGLSKPAGKGAINLEAFATDLATLVESSGKGKAVLVGHSIGGMTLQTLIRDHPQIQSRIAGLVLLHTTYTNPLKTMLFARLWLALQAPLLAPAMKLSIPLAPILWLLKWQSYLSGSAHLANRFGFGRFVTRSQLEHVTLLATRNPPAALARGDLAMIRWDATGVLDQARPPVLVVGGDKDIVTKLEASEVMAQADAEVALKVVRDVNHLGPMERADLYNELIAEFALQVQPSASTDVQRNLSLREGGLADFTRPDPSPRPGLH